MTKKDFLNALVDPLHADIMIKLRQLRKELRAIHWTLKYRYDKKRHTFYLKMSPKSTSLVIDNATAIAFRLLDPISNTHGVSLQRARDGRGNVFADAWINNG